MSNSVRPFLLLNSLAPGGAERATVSFARRLRALGTDVVVCTLTTRLDGPLAVELREAGVPRRDLGARRLADPGALVRLRRLLAVERPHVVHAHGQDASILTAVVRQLGSVPLAITRHVLEEPATTLWDRIRAVAARAAFRRADAAVAVSHAAARRLAELSGIPDGSIHVIPDGIDVERFGEPSADRRRELRTALHIDPDDPVVLVPAVLRDGNGYDPVLRAVPALRARVPAARVLFAGGGDQEATRRSQARALQDGVADMVRFLGPRTDIADLLAASDVVALPSPAQALPTALIEAAAAGRPVVATRAGGIPEVVVDGVSGLLVPPNAPAALAESIATLLLDGPRARLYGVAARGIARKRFSIDAQVAQTLELWGTMADRRRRRRRSVA
jgi:glycosyltransferase involved in cell wall biosynthesis